jgi:catalase
MDETQKTQLTATIAGGLAFASASAQQRMLEQFNKADPDYAERILRLLDQHRKTA